MAELKTADTYLPTGDQPKAIETLAAGLQAGERYQTLLGATGHRQDGDDGVDDREGRPSGARDRPQQDARRAALQRVPRVLPAQRGRVLRLLLRLLPARGVRPAGRPLHREGLVAERRHRPAAARRDLEPALAPRRDHRRLRLVHLRARLAGGVQGARRLPDVGRGAGPRPDAAQADRHPVRRATTRCSAAAASASRATSSRSSPRTRRRRTASPSSATRSSRSRTSTRSRARCSRGYDTITIFPATQYVTSKPTIERALGEIRARAEDAGQEVRGGGQDARGAPDPPAHRVRPRDDAGARLLQRDRELLAHPRRPPAGLGAAHAARLLPVRLRRLRRRVAPDGPADRRHVRGRPLAQADARRLRLPAPVRARQPAAALRRVPREGAADRVRRRRRPAPYEQRHSTRARGAADPPDRHRRPRGRAAPDAATRSTTCSTRSASARRWASARS